MASDNLNWKWVERLVWLGTIVVGVTLWMVQRTEHAAPVVPVPAPVAAEIPELRRDVTEIKVAVKGIETDMNWLKRTMVPKVANCDQFPSQEWREDPQSKDTSNKVALDR